MYFTFTALVLFLTATTEKNLPSEMPNKNGEITHLSNGALETSHMAKIAKAYSLNEEMDPACQTSVYNCRIIEIEAT